MAFGSPNNNGLRFMALLPFCFAAAAFSLTLVIVVAGRKPGQLNDTYILALNTTGAGQDIVQFTPTTNASASSTSGPLSGIDSFFQGILANFTNAVDGGLTAVENSLVLNLGQQLSLAPFYDLYLLNICRGNSSTTINKCSGYQDFLGTRFNVTSSVVVGTTNISAPIASDLVSSVNGISQLFTGALKIAFAFYIISLVGSGSTIIGSLVGVFISPKMLVVANVSFTVLSSTFQFLASVVATVIINLSQKLIGEVGGALNIHSHKGGKVLLLTWLGWLFILLAGLYWFYIWFVEVRDFDVRIMRKESRGEKERFSKTNGMTTGNVTEMR